MLQEDVQLIRRTLSGDESAFGTLVQKHQKGVHALIWRKIGDFHHAEELTQDTFLQAVQKTRDIEGSQPFFPGGFMSSPIGFPLIGSKGTNGRCNR